MKQLWSAPKTSSGVLPILCAVCVTAVLTAPVDASPPGEEKEFERQVSEAESAVVAGPSVVAEGGMRVIVDPETGEIVAEQPRQETDALSAPLANALNRSTEGLQVFELANGGRGMHLEGRFQHALVARVKTDGSLEIVCVNHAHEAEALLKRRSAEADPQPLDK